MDEVLTKFPDAWTQIGVFVKAIGQLDNGETLAASHPPFDELVNMEFDSRLVFAFRMQLLYHMLSSLGLQPCNVSDHQAQPYAHSILHKHFVEMLGKYDSAMTSRVLVPG